MDGPQPILKTWWFQIVFGGLAFVALAITLGMVAIHLRELKEAERELLWRQEQIRDIDWYAGLPAKPTPAASPSSK